MICKTDSISYLRRHKIEMFTVKYSSERDNINLLPMIIVVRQIMLISYFNWKHFDIFRDWHLNQTPKHLDFYYFIWNKNYDHEVKSIQFHELNYIEPTI